VLQYVIHAAVWTGFLVLPHLLRPGPNNRHESPDNMIMIGFTLSNFILIGFYYLNSLLLVPRYLAKQRMLHYILFIFGSFFTYVLISSLIKSIIPPMVPKPFNRPILSDILGSSVIFFLIFIISTGITIISQWFASEKKNREIENEKLQTELSYLKAQINPHFLFNVLNTIYTLSSKKSERTPDAVMKLSKLLRYVVNDAKADFVSLKQEIQYLENYIELQKMRLNEKAKIEFIVNGTDSNKQISPLLFIPFVENAFKYGVSTVEESPITIKLLITNDSVFFTATNKVFHNPDNSQNGTGLENVKKRLDLIYNKKHQLFVQQMNGLYKVELTISL
jgi:two-component system, LytTR family, sensor kinase